MLNKLDNIPSGFDWHQCGAHVCERMCLVCVPVHSVDVGHTLGGACNSVRSLASLAFS